MDQNEIERREKILNDFRRFQNKVPADLAETIESGMESSARSAFLELLILAIQAGRYFEEEDRISFAKENKETIVSAPAKPELKLLIVPGHAMPTKAQ